MSDKYYFSPSSVGFLSLQLKGTYYDPAGKWPNDAIELTDEQYAEFTGQAPEGKVLGAGIKGYPAWVDVPEPTQDEVIEQAEAKKAQLLEKASLEIGPLQDAVDLDIATDDEVKKLSSWKKYRVLVNRVDTNQALNIAWPEIP